jgi:hypothetical protein
MSGPLAVVHHGKPELLFAACDQLSDEDMWWEAVGLCVTSVCHWIAVGQS